MAQELQAIEKASGTAGNQNVAGMTNEDQMLNQAILDSMKVQ